MPHVGRREVIAIRVSVDSLNKSLDDGFRRTARAVGPAL